jgi:hypothetical protein
MTAWTEAMISDALDGTWTHLNHEGRVVTELVDADFTPQPVKGRPVGVKNVNKRSLWTPQEDDILITERRRNRPLAEIAWLVSRTEDGVKRRVKFLRVMGKMR